MTTAKSTLQALKAFKQLATVRPGDPEIAKMLARLYHQLGNPEEAKNVLQAHLHDYPTAVDLTHINILAELYMEASEWGLAVDNIQYADAQLCGQAGLPVELQVQLHSLLYLTKISASCTLCAWKHGHACFLVMQSLHGASVDSHKALCSDCRSSYCSVAALQSCSAGTHHVSSHFPLAEGFWHICCSMLHL